MVESVACDGIPSTRPPVPPFMIVSDLDHTMVDHEDKEYTSLLRFGALWESNYRQKSLLVFSTGRSPVLYEELRQEVPLLTPDILIMSVGTEIRYGDTMEEDLGWVKELDVNWNRDIIVEEAKKLNLQFQADSEQRPHKVSFRVSKSDASTVVEKLNAAFKTRGLKAKCIYSGGIDLDVLPVGAGKGKALAYLLKKFKAEGTTPNQTLVCGDSGNDAELFEVADVHGVIVGNAQEELVEWHKRNAQNTTTIFRATKRCAAGIIEAMEHFKFAPNVSLRDLPTSLKKEVQPKDDITAVAHEIVEYQLHYERWLKGAVENKEEEFQRLKAPVLPECTVIYPWGIENVLVKSVELVRPLYGSQKGKRFFIWVDRVRITKLAEDTWGVKYDNWTRSEDTGTSCSLTSAVLKKKAGTPNGVAWLSIHQTWLQKFEGKVPSSAVEAVKSK
ncbi:hypothetical protein R1sor_015881 [Riccia sorocarpa]|uniref:Sucrose-phosphatase n=1 Tax=Riccia sorocarpa TaxID=122646 RepID=A0ABD3HG75_9MARC